MEEKEVIVSGVHFDLTDAIKAYVNDKCERLFRHDPDLGRIRVDLVLYNNRSQTNDFDANGRAEGKHAGEPLIASASADDLYRAIDEMVDKLDRQISSRSSQKIAKRKED